MLPTPPLAPASLMFENDRFPGASSCRLQRVSTVSPGSRARSFPACPGSETGWSPRGACDIAPFDIAFRLVERRPHAEYLMFRSSIPVCRCPCQRFDVNRRLTTHDRVRLVR